MVLYKRKEKKNEWKLIQEGKSFGAILEKLATKKLGDNQDFGP